MNIWFDAAPDYDTPKPDCDCVLSQPQLFPVASLQSKIAEGGLKDAKHLVLYASPALYIEECGFERWLVGTPTGSGRFAVLDKAAILLLSFFATPTTIAHLLNTTSYWSEMQMEKAVEIFYALGFLLLCEEDALLPFDASSESTTLTAWIHVTNACNLHCDYCYLDKTSEHMAADTARQAIESVFRSAVKHQMSRVRFKYAGGEASLHMSSVLALHDYAVQLAQRHDIALDAILLSNGVVLSQQAIDNLRTRHIDIMISLDGLDASHNSQRRFLKGQGSSRYVLRTIERLLANGVKPHISTTVSGRNLDGLVPLMYYLLERDLPFTISYYRENNCSMHIDDLRFEEQRMITTMKDVFQAIEQHLPVRSLLGSLLDRTNLSAAHNYTCGVGQNYLVIDQHGGVAKCQADMKKTITTIDVADPLEHIRRDRVGIQNLSVMQKSACQECQWRFWCTGGCPLLTYQVTGRYDVQSPNCHIYQALFPEVLRLEALRLLRYISPVTL